MDLAYTLSNDSANGTDGDHMFLYTHMNVAIPYVSLLFFACFIGTTGNLLIISTVLFSKVNVSRFASLIALNMTDLGALISPKRLLILLMN